MDITSLLAGTIPSEQQYYAEDPFYGAGQNILGFQARPTNDWEALLGPVIQGLAGGALTGYGKRRAGQAAFDDARQSSLIAPYLQEAQFVGPRPEGEEVAALPESLAMYLQEEAPEGFTPQKARESILTTLLQQQQAQEVALEQSKQKTQLANELLKDGMIITQDGQIQKVPMITETRIANKADEAGAIERAKLEAQGTTGSFKKEDLTKEKTALANRDQSLAFIDESIQIAKKQNDKGKGVTGAITQLFGVPNAEKQTLDSIGEAMVGQVDKVLGREVNSDARKRLIDQFGPKWYDSDEDIQRKGQAFKDYIKSLTPATPGLEASGLLPTTSELPNSPSTTPVSREAAIAELRRRGKI